MMKLKNSTMDLAEVKALVAVTEEFVIFAGKLLEKKNISQAEYDEMTILKKEFLNDVQTKYL